MGGASAGGGVDGQPPLRLKRESTGRDARDMPEKPPPNHSVIRQPDDGVAPVVELIRSARQSLRIKQFTFTDPDVLDAVLDAKGRGVDVAVMLNPQRSSGSRANDETFRTLRRAGLRVRWSNPRFRVTHEKSIVVDERTALIATFNLCTKYFTQTRDYGLVTQDQRQVGQIVQAFEADWNRRAFHPGEHCGLLWSPDNARRLMASVVDAAERTLHIQHPKFVDATITERIAAAHQRGVKVHVLCGGKHGISDWDVLDTFASLRILHQVGAKVHRQKHLRLHAKLILVDGRLALLGSMNIDRSAFDLRRELGLGIEDAAVVEQLTEAFQQDWNASHRYHVPDPLDPSGHDAGELPHDPDFLHE